MPWSKGTENKVAHDLAAWDAQRGGGRSPNPDAFKPDVSAMPDCGSRAAAQLGYDGAKQPSSGGETRRSSKSGRGGWVMTRYLGSENDFGKPFFGYRHEMIDDAFLSSFYALSGNGISQVGLEGMKSLASCIFAGNPLDEKKIGNIFRLYQQIGTVFHVKNMAGPKTETQIVATASYKHDATDDRIPAVLDPIFFTCAWYIREGTKEAVDRVTEDFGTDLVDVYLKETIQLLMHDNDSPNSDNLTEAVKRVNMAYSSLWHVYPEDAKQYKTAVDAYLQSSGLSSKVNSIAVAADTGDEVLLGSWDENMNTFSQPDRFTSAFRYFGGRPMQMLVADLYEDMFRLILRREKLHYAAIPNVFQIPHADNFTSQSAAIHISIENGLHKLVFPTQESDGEQERLIYMTDDGLHLLWENHPTIVTNLFSADTIEGASLDYIYLTSSDKDYWLNSLVMEPIMHGKSDVTEYFPPDYPFVAKIQFPWMMENGQIMYMPQTDELRLLHMSKEALEKRGFHVITPLLASEGILLTQKAEGVPLTDFLFAKNGQITNLSHTALEQAVIHMTQEAEDLLVSPTKTFLQEQGMHAVYLPDIGCFKYQKGETIVTLKMDMSHHEYETYGNDEQKKWHGVGNWLIDADAFEKEIRQINNPDIDIIISTLKKHTTLVDPFSMYWDGKSEKLPDNYAVDILSLPRDLVKIAK